MRMQSKMSHRRTIRHAVVLSTVLAGLDGTAHAVAIDVGNPDVEMRWDNTVRYNLGVRAQSPDQKVLNNSTYDDSDSKFRRGDVVTNRVDLFSEFDVIYRKNFGFRMSGAAWYDQAYHDPTAKTNPAFTVPGLGDTSSAYPNNQYTNYTKRWNEGPSGEILDAFVFGHFDVADKPVDLKFGRHNVYWGESLFSFVNGVSNSQGPVDLRKASVNPGIEAKELFLPLNQISGQVQLTDTLSLGGQYMLEWAPSRLPDGGTYLGPVDFVTLGGGTYVINPAAANAAALGLGLPPGTIAPVPFLGIPNKPKNSGDWGVKAMWSPQALDGTLGFYYREYTEKLPEIVLGGFQPGLPIPTDVRLNYLGHNKLFGVSLGKEIAGVSVGSELVYRQNSALLMGGATVVGQEPRGDTFHALINGVKLLPGSPVYDSATIMGELTYNRLMKVTANAANFNGVGYAGCPTNAKFDGCATRDAWGLAVRFEPTWYQVFGGVDLSAPAFIQVGLKGNSPVLFGGYQGFGTYSLGVTAAVRKQYTVSLAYNGYLEKSKTGVNALGQPAVTTVNGIGDTSDRGWVSLTFKATF